MPNAYQSDSADTPAHQPGALPGAGVPPDAFASDLQAKLARAQIPALDGFRAIAVFLVILYHFGLLWVPGSHGVMMFFVLSGFLITWLLLKENERDGTISLRAFYRRRVLRIFPAFYAYWLLLVLLLIVAGKPLLWPHAIASFFYLTNYYNAILGDPNTAFSHTWSLAIEEQFYLLWPFVFIKFRKNLERMTIFLVCTIGGVWLYRFILYSVFDVYQGYFYSAFETRMDSLAVGCLLAVLLKRGVLTEFWRTACSSLFMPLLVLALLVASIYCGEIWYPTYRDVVGFAIEPPLIAVLIVQLISLSSLPALSWIDSGPARFLGRISYSLYLYQQVTLAPVRKLLIDQPLPLQLAAAVGVTVLIASASYYVIERPFLKLKTGKHKESANDKR